MDWWRRISTAAWHFLEEHGQLAALVFLGAGTIRASVRGQLNRQGQLQHMSDPPPTDNVALRVEWLAQDSDLAWVAQALLARRQEILDQWLEAAAAQPFHRGRREGVVADDIPRLLDALTDFLLRHAPRWVDASPPLDDPSVLQAATLHARQRANQGLQPADVVVEFRLLRQEIWRALRAQLPIGAPPRDTAGAAMLINDALDGAITIGLEALTQRIEVLRQEFLATSMHELRSPLAAVKGYAQLARRSLRAPTPDLKRVGDALVRIDGQAERIVVLLNTLMDASRIALGDLDLDRTRVDLAGLLDEVIADLGPETAERVVLDLPAGLDASGAWDATRLRQVVGNLVSNAAKYSAPGTPIEIPVRGDARTVRFDVRDRGIGIPPAELPQLFRRFYRTPTAIDQGIEGLGLGLYLCRGIVEAHGGRIWAESAGAGEGTCIRVELPREAPPAATP
jgi:signal transduction histidine kinase